MNLGLTEMIFLFVLGLLLFGPKKLPEIGRTLGKALAEFKRASTEFQSQLNDEVRKLEVEEAEDAGSSTSAPEGTTARGGAASYPLEPGSGGHAGETPEVETTAPETVDPETPDPDAQESAPVSQAEQQTERQNG